MVLYIYTAIANKSIRVIYYRYRNIRRRSDVGGSAKKMGMRIRELERLYGVKEGRPEKLPNYSVVNQSDIASQMGKSVDTLQNYK